MQKKTGRQTGKRTADSDSIGNALSDAVEPEPSISEYEAWQHSACDFGRVKPSDDAVKAVLRRAFAPDVEADLYPRSWPDDIFQSLAVDIAPLLDTDVILRYLHRITGNQRESPRDRVALAATWFAHTYGIWVLGEPVGRDRLLAWLNLYPRSDSIPALILAPLIHRELPSRAAPPARYFRSMAQASTLRRRRPRLIPQGVPAAHTIDAPPEFGWYALECWMLRAFVLRHRTECARLQWDVVDQPRLRALVDHAMERIRALNSVTLTEGRLAPQFFDLCRPLRDYLHWHVTEPTETVPARQKHHAMLRDLVRAIVPRMPTTPPIDLERALEGYDRIYPVVKEIWNATAGDRDPKPRQSMLEKQLGLLEFLASVETDASLTPSQRKPLLRARRRFWRACEDLRRIGAAEFAALYSQFESALVAPNQGLEGTRFADSVSRAAAGLTRRWNDRVVSYQRFKERREPQDHLRPFRVEEMNHLGKNIRNPIFFR